MGKGPDGKYKQKTGTFYGTRKQAEHFMSERTGEVYRGEFIEPSKMTVETYLNEWLDIAVKPPRRALNTYDSYRRVVSKYLVHAFGHLQLQQLNPMHIERFYAESKLAPSSQAVHHAIERR